MPQNLVVAVVALAALSMRLDAQADISFGAGVGVVRGEHSEGSGHHLSASVALTPHRDLGPLSVFSMRAEALVQSGSANGATCERMREQYCMGRNDYIRIAGVGTHVRLDLPKMGRVHFYVSPVGLGVYHRRTRSVEAEGPIWNCFVGGAVTSCPNNVPITAMSYSTSKVSTALSEGLGVELSFHSFHFMTEFRSHLFVEGNRRHAGAVPFTFGIRF